MSVDVFPVSFPTGATFTEADANPMRRQSAGVVGSGDDVVIDRGQASWSATWKTKKLFPTEIGQWRGFRDKLRGGARFFLGWDPLREYPIAYMPGGFTANGVTTRASGVAFDGTASLRAIGASGFPGAARDSLSLMDLPAGLKLNVGDYIGLVDGTSLSPAFNGGSWAGANGTIGSGVSPDPLGGSAANSLILSGSGLNDFAAWNGTGSAYDLKTFVLSVWLKLGTLSGAVFAGVKDLTSGVILGGGNVTTTSSWQRALFQTTTPLTAGDGVQAVIDPTNNAGTSGQTTLIYDPRLWDFSARKYSLHRVLDTAQLTADGSGNLTAWVEPEVPGSFTTGAVVNLFRAAAKFRMLSFDLPVQASGRNRPGQATFSAISTPR